VDHPLPWLKYVDAGDLDNDAIDFDGLNVESPTGEHLGDVDGFVVDSNSARPYYVVVDSGGWFKSKHYLLPVGHATLDADREVLVADLSRDRIEKFPGFNRDEFEKLSEQDLRRFNDETCQACSISGVAVAYSDSEPFSAAWDRSDYAYPNWWAAEPTRPDRMGAAAVTAGSHIGGGETRSVPIADEPIRRERVVAREGSTDAREPGEDSPHYAGRAQPGDVLGVETGGERTYVGDTAEDENKRRRDAEEAERKDRR
jgi:hypothetical protein